MSGPSSASSGAQSTSTQMQYQNQGYQSYQRYPATPLSVQSSAPSPMSSQMINSPIMHQQQQQQQNSYVSMNSPMPQLNQHSINSPMPPSQQQYNIYSPMPHNQHIQSPIMPQQGPYQQSVNSPMTSQLHSQSPSSVHHHQQQATPQPPAQHHSIHYHHNSPLPPPQFNTPGQSSYHHNPGSIQPPLTPTNQALVNSPYSNLNNPNSVPTPSSSMPYYSNQQQQHIQQPGTPHSNSNSSTSSNIQFDQINAQHYNQSNQMDPQQANYSFNHQNEGQDFYHQQQMLFKQQRDKELQLIQIKQLEFERLEKEKREREIQIELEEKKRKQEQHLQQRKRFLVELEFVQCLANPNYLNYLAGRGLFDNDSFKNYLKYLLYWKKPEYIKYIKFPECLFFLELIQHENLQSILKDAKCTSFILEQQLLHWKYYLRNREQQQRQEVEELIIDLAPESLPSEKEVELISTAALMSAKDEDVEMEEEGLSLVKNKTIQKSNKNVNSNASKAVVNKVKSKQPSSLPAIAPLNAAQVTTLKKILPHPSPTAQPNNLLNKKPSSNSLANAFSSSSNKLAKSSSNSVSSPANSKQSVSKTTTNSSGSSNASSQSPLKRPSSSSSSSMISQNRNSKQQAISKAQNH